ncbi:diguanylate cyclase [Bacillus sp. HMF5848]|uniref:diguanylate cyclase n=1 Tax=Bacillus sp. HMF5848 TaxID=2495421 RepID=UPI001639F8AE|nr:diguanylate cyclase [Bacillus sp. HMF5848]
MKRNISTFLRPFTKNISRAVIAAFSLILALMFIIGGSSIIGIERLNKVNELSEVSYKVLMQMKNIEDSMTKVEGDIRVHYSGDNWKSYVDGSMGALAFFDMENQQLNVDIFNVGNQFPWSVQVIQGSFTLNQNKRYKLSFDGKSSTDRFIELLFQNSVDYYRYHTEIVELTNKMQTHTVYFEMEDTTDALTHLVFALGNLPNKPVYGRHHVIIDHVSLTEIETGTQLIHNGEFVSKDVQSILWQSEEEITQAIHSYREYVSGRPKQQALVDQLDSLLQTWLYEKREMIYGLNLKLASSGNLNADSELQSYESINETKKKIGELINEVKNLEEIRLAEKRSEANVVKRIVFSTLVSIVVISIILCMMVYLYFNKAIIKPIRWASESLKKMAEDDLSMRKEISIKNDNVHLSITEIRQLYDHMIHYYNLLSDQIQMDGLTGLTNRTTFDYIIKEWANYRSSFYLVMIDIDHFKKINDTYGHLVGDDVIKLLGKYLLTIADDKNLCFRYGGEEFSILIRDRELNEVVAIAEHLRLTIAETPIAAGKHITISIGIAQYLQTDDSPIPVIQRADTALYQSKSNGRNCTTVFNKKDSV